MTKLILFSFKIPEALSVTFNPSVFLEVIYPQPNGPPIAIKPGQTLHVNRTYPRICSNPSSHRFSDRLETAIPPMYAIGGLGDLCDEESTFVITMFDPDAPSPLNPSAAPLRHFVGSDFIPITPREYDLALIANTSHAMSPYIQPAPTAGSPPHR